MNVVSDASITRPSALETAERLTRVLLETEGLPRAARELAVLKVQMRHWLAPFREGDVLAGRVCTTLVGISPEPGGFGYFVNRPALEAIAEEFPAWSPRVGAILEAWAPVATKDRVRAAMPADLRRWLPDDDWAHHPNLATGLDRLAGVILDFRTLVTIGMPGLRQRLADRLFRAADRATIDLVEGMEGALDILAEALERYSDDARPSDPSLADDLLAITTAPPRTLRQAAQLIWIYALLAGVWNYGRLDDTLGGFLVRDLEAGRLTEESATELLAGWWRLMKAYENQYNNRVIIGGVGRRDPASADAFARLAIQATRRVRLNQPQLSLRFVPGENPELMSLALDAIGEGCTFPMLYNDAVNVPAVARAFGIPEDEARMYQPYGCGETVIGTRGVTTPNAIINLPKALEVALNEGVEPRGGWRAPVPVPPVEEMRDISHLWRAYTRVVEGATLASAAFHRLQYDVTARQVDFLFISLLTDDCLARGRGVLNGGVVHGGATFETYGNAVVADSFAAIERVVFLERRTDLSHLVAALASNFAEDADLRAALVAVPKYGNDDPFADAWADRVHRHVCLATAEAGRRAGLDPFLVVIINNWANVLLGLQTGATADGRRAGEPFNNGNNPSPGRDVSGVTAFLKSLAKPDARIHAGAVQNMRFAPEMFTRERAKLEALLEAYWSLGGTQAMITVVNPDDLRAAMDEPEKWGHLMVRVGGFSARFVDLPRDCQLEILARTTHG